MQRTTLPGCHIKGSAWGSNLFVPGTFLIPGNSFGLIFRSRRGLSAIHVKAQKIAGSKVNNNKKNPTLSAGIAAPQR